MKKNDGDQPRTVGNKWPTPREVCEVIDHIGNCRMDEFMTGDADDGTKEYKFIGMVSRFAHLGLKPSCLKVHKDWLGEFKKVQKGISRRR